MPAGALQFLGVRNPRKGYGLWRGATIFAGASAPPPGSARADLHPRDRNRRWKTLPPSALSSVVSFKPLQAVCRGQREKLECMPRPSYESLTWCRILCVQ